jgi:hypothetical protein
VRLTYYTVPLHHFVSQCRALLHIASQKRAVRKKYRKASACTVTKAASIWVARDWYYGSHSSHAYHASLLILVAIAKNTHQQMAWPLPGQCYRVLFVLPTTKSQIRYCTAVLVSCFWYCLVYDGTFWLFIDDKIVVMMWCSRQHLRSAVLTYARHAMPP